MASSSDYDNKRDNSRLLGIPLDDDNPPESLKITPDTTAWDVYNNHAERVESEIVQDWKDTLNNLLIFAGLYSGVLTGFITSSMQLIQPDSSDDARDILLHISRQLAVTSTPAFDLPSGPFIPPAWALRVNYCFFFSLSCALITALAAVLALQWAGSYGRGLNPSSVENRALQRQFRREGAKRWKLEHIIASLPTIIFISLLLFFVGLTEWLWNIHHGVAVIVMVGASVGGLFYIVTTLISMLSVVAPFRTPASRYIPLWFGLFFKFISGLFKRAQPQSTTVNKVVISIGTLMTALHIDNHIPEPTDAVPEPTGVVPQIQQTSYWELFFRRALKPVTPLYLIEPFEAREHKAVAANKDIKLSSLLWVARSISVEPCHRQTLMIIMEAILKQPKWELQHHRTDGSVWRLIFAELYVPYKEKTKWVHYSSEDLRDASLFVRGVSSIGQHFLDDIEFGDFVWYIYGKYTGHLVMHQTMKQWKQLDLESERRGASSLKDTEVGERDSRDSQDNGNPNQVHIEEGTNKPPHMIIQIQPGENTGVDACSLDDYSQLCRQVVRTNLDVALSFRDCFPLEFIVATLQQVKRDPKKLALIKIEDMFRLITKHLHIKPDYIASARPLPFPVLDLVQEVITTRLFKTAVHSLDPVVYSSEVTKYLKETNNKEAYQSAISAHEAIMEQTISNLIQINALKAANSPRVQEILVKLDQLAQCNFGQGKHSIILALSSMLTTKINIWNQNNRIYTAKAMLSLLKVEDSNFKGDNWAVWWTEILPAFAGFIDEDEVTESIVIKHGRRALWAHLPDSDRFSDDQIARLINISHRGVRLFATAVTQSTALAKSILSIDSYFIWTPSTAWMEFIDLCFAQLSSQASEDENFLRAFAVGSSLDLYDHIYDNYVSHRMKSPPDLFKYLSYPVLPVVLRHAEDREFLAICLLDIIAENEAFSTEFSKARGFTWIPAFVRKNPVYFEKVLSIVNQAIGKCQSYSSAFLWIDATFRCQVAAASTIGDDDDQITAERLWEKISKNANRLINHIKVTTKTRIIPPAGHNGAPNDMQERSLEANLVRDAVGIAKNSGLIEDDVKSKLNNTAPEEWSVYEKKEWETLVDMVIAGFEHVRTIGEPISYKEVIIPPYDVALLRKLTLTGPDDFYICLYPLLGEVISSSTMSLEYFHAPTLNKIMRRDFKYTYQAMDVLRGIYKHTWFPRELIEADGLKLLPLQLHTGGLYDILGLVSEALPLAMAYKDTLIWLCLTFSCLNSVGLQLNGAESDRFGLLLFAQSYLDQLQITLGKMNRKWHNDREYQSIDDEPDEDDTDEEDVKSNARLWSPGEWENVQEIVDELLDGGLKRGYIMPAPSAEHHRFIRDPDGLCLHSRPQRAYISAPA